VKRIEVLGTGCRNGEVTDNIHGRPASLRP
jgi:hypothetical protein